MRNAIAIALAAAVLCVAATPKPDFVIDPASRVGPVTPFTDEADLIELLGSGSVARAQIDSGGDFPSMGTVLFPGTSREALVVWRREFRSPRMVKISEPGAPWITVDGVSIGTSLADLEELNGKPFVVASYDLNMGARTMSWEGGAFASELVLDLGPGEKLSGEEIDSVGSRMTHRSSDPLIRKLDYTVRAITVEW